MKRKRKRKRMPWRERVIARLGGVPRAESKRKRIPWRERVISRFGGVSGAESKRRIQEAYRDGRRDGNDDPADSGTGLAAGGFGYRTISGGVREPVVTWEKNLETAWQLKQSHPMINRAGEIQRDYIIGLGVKPQATDPELQQILDDFWADNKMSLFSSELVRQWSDYGAQVVPVFARESDGRARLGYIDPSLIERVIAHPQNAREMWAVVIREQDSTDEWIESVGKQVYRVIRQDDTAVISDIVTLPANHPGKLVTAKQARLQPWETTMLKSFSLDEYTGTCAYIRKNADSNQTVGRSDYLQVADTCDQLDMTIFELGEREALANMIFADVAVDALPSEVKERARELWEIPPTPGSINVHGITETWNTNSPTLNQTASCETAKLQQGHIAGGVGFPVSWFGRGDETNRATAQAQGDPTWKTLRHDQGIIQAWLLEILHFVRDQAEIAGAYRPDENTDSGIGLPMPEMITKDVVGITSALSGLVGALSIALQDNLITRDSAIDATAKVLAELGIEEDTELLKDEAANEKQTGLLSGGSSLFNPKKAWQNVHAPLGDSDDHPTD